MPFCPECGNQVDAGKKFCYSCGQPLPVQSPTNPGAPSRSIQSPASPVNRPRNANDLSTSRGNHKQVYSVLGADLASSRTVSDKPKWYAEDSEAIHKFKIFAILEIVGLVFSIAIPFAISGALIESVLSFSSLSNTLTGIGDVAYAVPILIMLGLILGIVAASKIRSAFKSLSEVDRSFSTPKTLSSSLMVGMGLGVIGSICLLLGFLNEIAAVSTSNSAQLSAGGLLLLVGAGMFVLAVIAVFIGGIGVALGLWRAGGRYDDGMTKVSAILHLIPFLFFIAPIVLFVGVHSAGNKIDYESSDESDSADFDDNLDKIAQLKSLLDDGVLTQTEFEDKKNSILHPQKQQDGSQEDELKKLKGLYDSGALTETEYGEAIRKVLAKMQG